MIASHLDPRRAIALVLVALSLGLLAVLLAVYFDRGFVPGDAFTYLAAGERLNAGHPLYALSPGDRPVDLKPPYWTVPLLSPPFIAVVFRPLALLGDLGAYLWWFVTMAAIAVVLIGYLRRRPVLTALAILALCIPLTYEIGVGNVNALLLLGSVLAWRWSGDERDGRPGIVTAIMVALKVSPIVLAWWLITQRRWPAIRAFVATGVALLIVSVLGAGIDAHLRFIEITRNTATIGQSDLSVGGLARSAGVPAAIAGFIPGAILVIGIASIALFRHRPALTFAIAVATMTLGSPVVNINSYALLLGCLAPLVRSMSEDRPERARTTQLDEAIATPS